jgi:Flp pilus assembly protein TadG
VTKSTERLRKPVSVARKLIRDKRGAAAILAGVAVPAVMGTAALGIDVGSWYATRASLQSMADTLASSGALEIAYENGYSTSQAWGDLELNRLDTSKIESLTINVPPLAGAYTGNAGAVEVVVTSTSPVYFAGFFMSDPLVVTTRAVANTYVMDEACLVGLDETASKTVQTSGNVSVQLNCGIAANSNNRQAMFLTGDVDISVPMMMTAGDIVDNTRSGTENVDVQVTHSRRIEDPYEDLDVPFYGGCDQNNMQITSSTTLAPGVYCGGIKIASGANVDMQPGTYVMDAGDFDVSGNAVLNGSDVTIILTSSHGSTGSLAITGGTEVNLSAPTDGEYGGVLFYQDRNANPSGVSKVTGNADLHVDGAIYFPSQEFHFGGNGSFQEDCTQIIAASVALTGDFSIADNCDHMPVRTIGRRRAALVE